MRFFYIPGYREYVFQWKPSTQTYVTWWDKKTKGYKSYRTIMWGWWMLRLWTIKDRK